MARKSITKGKAKASLVTTAESQRGPTLGTLRSEIDHLDRELITLLNRRAEIAVKIGKVKAKEGLEVWSSAREEEVITKALSSNQGPLPPETLRLIFRELMSGSRALQRTIRIAYLGPKHSYSHLASISKFGEAVEHVPVESIAAVFEEVNRRHVEFGIVPLENSTDGGIADTLDMFIRIPGMKIRAEVRLLVHHYLLGKCERSEVLRVYSKSQALSQCRHWIGKNLPQARTVDVVSTTAAAEHAAKEEFAAAVASRAAAKAYKLNILAENIEDHPHNLTRFAVIGESIEPPTGHDKTTLLLRLRNQTGTLVDAIAPFKKGGVNMRWIESFPAPDSKGDEEPVYLFFLDIDGHIEDKAVKESIDAVRKRCERLDILGSYARGECVES